MEDDGMISLKIDSSTAFLIFYVVRFFIMAAVIVGAIALGAFLRKKYDEKKAAKKDGPADNIETAAVSEEEN